MMSYRQLTALRALFGGSLLGLLIANKVFLAYGATTIFLILHWFASFIGQKHKVERADYHFSSLVSSGVLLITLGIVLVREFIPVLLAAMFIAAFVIKIIFLMQSSTGLSKKFKPMATNWSLSASMFFLACYYVEPSEGTIILSGMFLAYLVVSIGVFTKQVMAELQSQRESVVQDK